MDKNKTQSATVQRLINAFRKKYKIKKRRKLLLKTWSDVQNFFANPGRFCSFKDGNEEPNINLIGSGYTAQEKLISESSKTYYQNFYEACIAQKILPVAFCDFDKFLFLGIRA